MNKNDTRERNKPSTANTTNAQRAIDTDHETQLVANRFQLADLLREAKGN